MMSPLFLSMLVCSVLGLGLAIPSYTCIVMGNLDIIRKKGKLSPTDVIFLAKGIVNLFLQCVMSLQGMFLVLCPAVFYAKELIAFMNISICFLTYYNYWLTFWLSAHYCTTITNLSYGFFIWIKRIVSNFLSHLLFLTALGVFIVSVPSFLLAYVESIQSSENGTEASMNTGDFFFYLVPADTLGANLPFCLSLLCLVLTSSFLLRHVWRVKNNDSGSTRPNLQAHVTALRTIFFFILMFAFSCISQTVSYFPQNISLAIVSCDLQFLSPSVEAVIIFQANSKLRRILLGRFWTRN
ncbi:taste receptor type 2 member 9-like [Lithobates pipiens]